MNSLDRRTTPARADMAADSLKGHFEPGLAAAMQFVKGEPARIIAPSAPLHREPRLDAAIDTEALAGEALIIYERHEGFAWVQLAGDAYVGYLAETALSTDAPGPTHKLNVLRSFVYPGPSIKLPPMAHLSLGASVHVTAETGDFAQISTGGYVWSGHLVPLAHVAADAVAVAEDFLGVPYLWGGKTSLGLDCSGLVQLAWAAAGIKAPRDSDMQEAGLGVAMAVTPGLSWLQRGDLVFWKGHVGIMQNSDMLLHANGHHMLVASEPLAVATARILAKGAGPVTGIRRS